MTVPADLADRFSGTIVELLLDAARERPAGVAYLCGDDRLTYAQAGHAVLALAARLRRGLSPGACIATVLPGSIDACIAHYAVLASGAQLLPVNAAYVAREIETLLADATPALLIADASLRTMLEPLAGRLRIEVLWMAPGDRAALAADPAATGGPLPDAVSPHAFALLQYTGGTSGRPKGVNLTHQALLANVRQREDALPTRMGQERILCAMPLFHSYGMAMGLYLSARCHGTLVILPAFKREQVLAMIAQERITIFPGSPTIYISLLDHPSFAATDWSSLRCCYSGAAALPVTVLKRWEQAVGVPIFEGYGQTEAGPVLSYNGPTAGRKVGSVGRALADTDIQVVDLEHGSRVLGPNERGEIRARGPQLMSGYRNLPAETADALRDGWLYTGDIGEIDDDGFLFIRDRKKDMIITSGYNVYPREVEDALMEHPDVLEAAVVGRPDDYRGQVVHAYVVLKAGRQCTADDLGGHCESSLAKYKRPARLSIVTGLPKTAANKTDKKALIAIGLQDGRAAGVDVATS